MKNSKGGRPPSRLDPLDPMHPLENRDRAKYLLRVDVWGKRIPTDGERFADFVLDMLERNGITYQCTRRKKAP